MRYTVVAVAEVDVDVVDAVGVYDDELLVARFGVDTVIINVAELYSESQLLESGLLEKFAVPLLQQRISPNTDVMSPLT
jgi:hypothetical protein